MAYIDQPDLYEHIPNLNNYIEPVNLLTKTERFDYQSDKDFLWHEIYNLFDNDDQIRFYNNKIYSNDLDNKKRFIASDLLDNTNITIKTDSHVEKINFEDENAVSINLKNKKIIKFKDLILAGGAIENVKILNNSNNEILKRLPIGETIYDHAGVSFYYLPNSNFNKYISIGHLQVRAKDLKWQIYLSKVPNVPYLIVTIAQAKKEDNKGKVQFEGDKHKIDINYFTEKDTVKSMLDGYNYINNKLKEIGYTNIDPTEITEEYILKSFDSIYHYHGTCPYGTVVDNSCKVLGINNLYIGDISVLNESVPGSTSVSSMLTGYRFSKIYLDKILDTEEEYDIVIVGSGPAGSMISRSLSDKIKDKKILLLEKGSSEIKENFDEKYRSILDWSNAMNDPLNSHTLISENEKTIWLGRGLGGGTLHFGMAYIDQPDLYEHIPNLNNYIEPVNLLTKTERFDYQSDKDFLWHEIYNLFDNDDQIRFYNNKIYSNDLDNKKRFIASDLLDNTNITIKTDSHVEKINFEDENAVSINLKNKKIIKFKDLILAGGAIENVKILNNSNNEILKRLPIGETIYDHAGVSFYYLPNSNFNKYISIGHLQVRAKDLKWQIYLSKVPNVPYLIVTIAQAKKEDNKGKVQFEGDKHKIDINYFTEKDTVKSMLDGYNYINNKLKEIGYTNIDPTEITEEYILKSFDSIYHYHGTCPYGTVVDNSCKVLGINNLYIGDISVLNESVPGSTSVSSMLTGYRFSKIYLDKKILETEDEINKIKKENGDLKKKTKNLFTIDELRNYWQNEKKMYVVIQNDGSKVGIGEKKVYNMGDYWNGGGHPVNLARYVEPLEYNFTNLLTGRHGTFSVWRIKRGGAIEVGLLDEENINQKIINNEEKINNLKDSLLLFKNETNILCQSEEKNFQSKKLGEYSFESYSPFTKIDTWNDCLKLVSMENVSLEFLNLVKKIIGEIIISDELANVFKTKNFIQKIAKNNIDDYKPPLHQRIGWDSLNLKNNSVDFIWEIEKGEEQIDKVLKNLLNTIYFALSLGNGNIWSFDDDNSLVYKSMIEAVNLGVFNLDDYIDLINDESYNRIVIQEFFYCLVYTSWEYTKKFDLKLNSAWKLKFQQQIDLILPSSNNLYQNYIQKILREPNFETIKKLSY